MKNPLHLIAKDILQIGQETAWCYPELAEFYCDLKRITQHQIMRASFRGLRRVA
jgi:hypothetical protein